MAEVVRIRGGHGAEYDVDLELNPSLRARIEAGELKVVKVKAGKEKAAPEPEPEPED